MKYLAIFTFLILLSCNQDQNINNNKASNQEESNSKGTLSDIEQNILENPDNPVAYYNRAIFYKNNKKYSRAIEDINRALRILPDSNAFKYEKAEILYNSGLYKQNTSHIDEAKIYLDNILKYETNNINSLLLKSKILLFEKDTDASMQAIVTILKNEPTLAEAYFLKALIYEIIGNDNFAKSSYQTAIEMDVNYYDAYINLGIIYAKEMNNKAISYYNSALEIQPNSIEALRNKGLYYHFSKNYLKARVSFMNILNIDSLFEEAYFNIGNTYIGMYNDNMDAYSKDTTLNKAIEYFYKAVNINPKYVQAVYNLGVQYEYKGEIDSAKKYYLRAIDLENNYTPALDAINSL